MLMLMSAVETGQMSAVETGQMSAVETRQMSTIETGYHEGWDIKRLCAPMVAMIPTGYGFGYSQTRMT